ncbi:hypothetical protein J6590_061438 [Homalodisca vitripennis]|nr:hypothetical protein J6590_061438 [Homalodisca vitripennis]
MDVTHFFKIQSERMLGEKRVRSEDWICANESHGSENTRPYLSMQNLSSAHKSIYPSHPLSQPVLPTDHPHYPSIRRQHHCYERQRSSISQSPPPGISVSRKGDGRVTLSRINKRADPLTACSVPRLLTFGAGRQALWDQEAWICPRLSFPLLHQCGLLLKVFGLPICCLII